LKKDIKVDMTELENNQVMLDVTVDKEDVKGYVDFAYKVAAQQYRIPGFRPGKAPRKVLDNALGKRVIFAQATDALLNETYPMAVETQALVVLGDPNIQTDELVKLDYDYTYHVELNVKPKLELTSYDPVEVEMPPMEPTEKEVMSQIDRLRGFYYTLENSRRRKVREEDFVVLDLDTVRDGEKVEDLCVEDRVYELGRSRIPAELEAGVVGMSIHDTKDIEYVPEEGADPVVSTVTVKGIRDKVLPEFDDEFAKKTGFENADAMYNAIYDTVAAQKKSDFPRRKEDLALNKLAERLQGEPSALQKSLIYNDLLKQIFNSLQEEGTTLDAYLAEQDVSVEQFEKDIHQQAEDVAKHELALDAIVRDQGIECSKEDVLNELKAAGYDDAEAAYKEWVDSGRMSALRATIMRAKAGRWLVESTIVHTADLVDDAVAVKKTVAGTDEDDA
jgi:trigger factor